MHRPLGSWRSRTGHLRDASSSGLASEHLLATYRVGTFKLCAAWPMP
jgi:hypothetical protein